MVAMEKQRGQIAIEMFFAFALALLAIYWMGGYLNVFEGSVSRIGINEQQKVVAMGLARMVNTVCTMNGDSGNSNNLSIIAPCIVDRGRNVFYQIKTGATNRQLVVSNLISNNTNATVTVSCPLQISPSAPINTQCAENQVLCIGKKGNNVIIKQSNSGACA